MKLQVELLSCLAYKDKKDGSPKTRLGYRMLGDKYRQNTATLKGYTELSCYVDNHDLFNSLKPEFFGVQAELEVIEEPSAKNPLRNVMKIKTIKVGENVINIL